MGGIGNRSGLEEVDELSRMLWWSVGGAILFLILFTLYCICKIPIDDSIQHVLRSVGINQEKRTAKEQIFDDIYVPPQ